MVSNCASFNETVARDESGSCSNSNADSKTACSRTPLHLDETDVDDTGVSAKDGSPIRYYRIVFRGVVALLKSPHVSAPRNGFYLSYGEIFTVIEVSETESDNPNVVQVHSVLTGGYTHDTVETCGSGYLFLEQGNAVVAEPLGSVPFAETGFFHYQIIATTPIPILTGPAMDAPKTKAVVLPYSIQEISVRVRIDGSVESDVCFLRLSHRRGWIADRKRIAKSDDTVAVVKQICWDSSDMLVADDGNSSVVSSSTVSSFHTTSRHRPPRKRRDAASKGTVLQDRVPTGKSHLLSTNQLPSCDATDQSIAPSSNVSMLSDDSSNTNPSTSVQQVQTALLDSSLSVSRSVTSLPNYPGTAAIQANKTRNFFLMRVHATKGLKILDAPQFQVNRLIHRNKYNANPVSSSHVVSKMELYGPKKHHSIFQTMSGRLVTTGPSQSGNPAVFDVSSKNRILPFGVLFEASTRMETTGSYSEGAGLIKLSDYSGWAIVPCDSEPELFTSFDGTSGRLTGAIARTFEEVGSAALATTQSNVEKPIKNDHVTTWLRVMTRNGLTVSCPPLVPLDNDDDTSPTSSRGSSAINGSNHGSNAAQFPSNESDVASSVGSSFLDAMFRTPKKKGPDFVKETVPRPNSETMWQPNTIPCGMFVEVERWVDAPPACVVARDFGRLCGGQGWVPLSVSGKPSTARVARPEFRVGSFWFRVQSSRGVKVRLGPSTRAPSIRSDDGVYFRFECGEFLRGSEILTVFSENGEPTESFVKLFRNRHVRLHMGHDEYRTLASLTVQAEWVQIYSGNDLFLEECTHEPRIERHKQGWRYNVVPDDGVAVQKGPSFASEKSGIILFGGESVLINERVSPFGDKISWLRMKDGQGWIHDVNDAGEHIVIPHSLRHRAQTSRPHKPNVRREGNDKVYNDIITRLFNNDERYRPRREDDAQRHV